MYNLAEQLEKAFKAGYECCESTIDIDWHNETFETLHDENLKLEINNYINTEALVDGNE